MKFKTYLLIPAKTVLKTSNNHPLWIRVRLSLRAWHLHKNETKSRKRVQPLPCQRSPVSCVRPRWALIKLIEAANRQSPVIARKFLPLYHKSTRLGCVATKAINWSVKTPWHERMEAARSGLWAPDWNKLFPHIQHHTGAVVRKDLHCLEFVYVRKCSFWLPSCKVYSSVSKPFQ